MNSFQQLKQSSLLITSTLKKLRSFSSDLKTEKNQENKRAIVTRQKKEGTQNNENWKTSLSSVFKF